MTLDTRTRFAAGHPFNRPDGRTTAQLVADVMAHNRALFAGYTMLDDDPDPDDPPADTDLDTEVVIGGRTFKVADLKRIAADEKRQGKRAGERAALEALGVDNLDAAKALIDDAKKRREADESEAQRVKREAEEETAAAKRERAEAATDRRVAAMERALVRRGVEDDDLDDAVALLTRDLSADADADAIAESADKLKTRRPALFGDDTTPGRVTPPPRGGNLPGGAPPRERRTTPGQFGAEGLRRAEKRGFIKRDA